jgi:hypothetical protein
MLKKLKLKHGSMMSMLLLKTAGLVIPSNHNLNFGCNGLSKTPNFNQMLLQFKLNGIKSTRLPKLM